MDIARLGVSIDPTRATQGAQQARREITALGRSARQSLGEVDQSARRAGSGVQRMAGQTKSGFSEMSRGVFDVLDAFGLMNNGIGRMIRRNQSAFQGLIAFNGVLKNGQGAMAESIETTASLGGVLAEVAENAAEGSGGIEGLTGKFKNMIAGLGGAKAVIAGLVVGLIGLVAVLAAVAIGFKAITASIPEAAKIEQFRVRMAVAMGSFEESRKRFKELKAFADETPFGDEEVFSAGVKLQAMTQGALASTEALKSIGGAAFLAGKSFDEVADLAGRAYNAIELGMDFIEPIKTMASYGLIAGATVKEVIRLGDEAEKSGRKGSASAEQWAAIYADLEKNQVALILASQTWNGLISTIDGNWAAVKAEFGEPIMDALKPVLRDIIALMPRMKEIAGDIGRAMGTGVTYLYNAFKSGQLFEALDVNVTAALESAASNFTAMWMASTVYWGNDLGNRLGESIQNAANAMREAFGEVIAWIGKQFGSVIADAAVGMTKVIPAPLRDKLLNMAQDRLDKTNLEAAQRKAIQDALPEGSPLKDPVDPTTGGVLPPRIFEPVPNDYNAIFAAMQKDSPVGTTWQDRAAALNKDILGEGFGEKNPDLPKRDPMDLPTELTGGGAGKATEKPVLKAEKIESEMDNLMERWGELGKQMDSSMAQAAESVTSNMTSALTGMIMGTKSAKQAFAEMATGIVNDIVSMIIKMTIQLTLARALGQYGIAFQGIAAGVAHSGGTVGATNMGQTTMPRYHQGGTLSSEKVVKVDKGETILTRRRSAELSRELAANREGRNNRQQTGGSTATIINVLDRNEITDAVARNPGAVINALSRNLPQVRRMVMKGERP